jgi:hypothetical protein
MSLDLWSTQSELVRLYLRLDTTEFDPILVAKFDTAQSYVETLLGRPLSVAFPAGIPEPVLEAIRMLAAHLFQTGAASVAEEQSEMLFGVHDLIAPYRAWEF